MNACFQTLRIFKKLIIFQRVSNQFTLMLLKIQNFKL